MKNMYLKIGTYFFLGCILIMNYSCSDDGKDGTPGATGTANVIYSQWMDLPPGITETIDGSAGRSYNFAAPQLSQTLFDKGAILVYSKYTDSAQELLPITLSSGGFDFSLNIYAQLQNIKIFFFRHVTPAGTPPDVSASLKIRYILIPGGVAATARSAKLDYKNMSYDQVCHLLNIPM